MGEDIVKMSLKELKRVGIIQRVAEKKLKQARAGQILELSVRQIGRLVGKYRKEGEKGLVHRSRGRASNRRHPEVLRQKVLKIYEKQYRDFGPTLAWEKLEERNKIRIGCQTLRRWLLEAGLWEKKREIKEHRQWRERKANYGEMQQFDGSHHDWLEGRGSELVLKAYIDDATNRVYGKFYDYEGTLPAMDSFYGYAKKYGLPRSVYLDRHPTYKARREATIEEQLEGKKPWSQFQRALETLAVNVIHAHSAPAKGRVERLFETFQDRLIKEMRLAGVKNKEEANIFLETYLPNFNRRFGRIAKHPEDLHRSVPEGVDLKQVLSIQTMRALRKDNTVRHENKIYLIEEKWKMSRPREIMVQERIDGGLYLVHEGRMLKYREVNEAPRIEIKKPSFDRRHLGKALPLSHPLKAASFKLMQARKQAALAA